MRFPESEQLSSSRLSSMTSTVKGYSRWLATTLLLLFSISGYTGNTAEFPPSQGMTDVTIDLYNILILEIDDKASTFEIDAIIEADWRDPRLAFNPEDYSGNTVRVIKGEAAIDALKSEIWWPGFEIVDSRGPRVPISVTLRVDSEGFVLYSERFMASISQKKYFHEFPFDKHEISFTIQPLSYENIQFVEYEDPGWSRFQDFPGSWLGFNEEDYEEAYAQEYAQAYDGDYEESDEEVYEEAYEETYEEAYEVSYNLYQPPIVIPGSVCVVSVEGEAEGPQVVENAYEDGSYCFTQDDCSASTAYCAHGYEAENGAFESMPPTAMLEVGIKRKSIYYLTSIIIPMILIVLVSSAVFWMNSETTNLSDRLSVTFTSILTVVAFDFVAGGDLPRLGYSTALNHFLTMSYLFLTVNVIENVLVSNLEERRAVSIDRFFRWAFPVVYLLFAVAALSGLFLETGI